MDINENYVTLKLFDFACSPVQISNILGIEPTKIGVKGQEYSIGPEDNKQKKVWPYNYWEFRVKKKDNTWISEHVDHFISQVLSQKKSKLKEVIATCEAELSIVLYYYSGSNPGFHFSNKNLQLIAEIGAELDLDIYCLSESE